MRGEQRVSGRILIVDDIATNRVLLSHLLQKAFYEVETAESGREALEKARANPPDLALLDVMMPGMDGFELTRRFKADPKLCEVPIVIVTALDAVEDRRTGIQAGADDFLTKPVREVALYARMRSLLRMKAMRDELRLRDETSRELGMDGVGPFDIEPPPGAPILGVTSREEAGWLKDSIEKRTDCKVHVAYSAQEAMKLLNSTTPEAVLIDALNVSDLSADFISALRQRPETRSAALLALVSDDDMETAAALLDAGANDYLMRPLDAAELTMRLGHQLRYKAHADMMRNSMRDGLRLAVTDPLTGLRNRRYVDTHLKRMVEQAKATGSPLSLLAFDLDRFKSVNDTYGHPAGDAVLVEFAKRLTANARSVDLIGRIGGEEFIIAMPDAALENARAAAERIREQVESPCFETEAGALSVTVSIGVATLHADDPGPAKLFSRADSALFIAKSAGRNRVMLEAA